MGACCISGVIVKNGLNTKGNTTTYEVNLNDQVTKMVQPNEGEYTYKYDIAGRLGNITSPLGYTTYFSYDLIDNIIKERNSLDKTTYVYDDKHDGKHEDGKHDSEYPHGNKHNGKHDKDGTNAIRVVTTERSYEYDETALTGKNNSH